MASKQSAAGCYRGGLGRREGREETIKSSNAEGERRSGTINSRKPRKTNQISLTTKRRGTGAESNSQLYSKLEQTRNLIYHKDY